MSEAEHDRIRRELHEQVSQEAAERIRKYIAGEALHLTVGGFVNGDDSPEGKNV